MSIVTRYFSTSSAGAADGTTWSDRAALFSGGNWSSVVTGFDFSGSDSLVCLIGPGTYSCSQSLASGLFSNAPSASNNLMLCGCDSSGNALSVPDPDWLSAMADFDDSTLPVIATTTNIATVNLAHTVCRLLKFTATGNTTNAVIGNNTKLIEWCVATTSSSNTSTVVSQADSVANSVLSATGTAYSAIVTANTYCINSRLKGNASASSGNRHGWNGSSGTPTIIGCTIFDHVGSGIAAASTSTSFQAVLYFNTIVDNAAAGILMPSTASQTAVSRVIGCLIANNGTYGIDLNTNSHALMFDNRLRDNTSGNIGNSGNHFVSENYTTDTDDTEFVDYSGNDFRVKAGATIWASGYGAGRQLDFPDAANTLNDDTTNGTAGTYAGPATTDVKSGVQYGAGGTEFTGSYSAAGGGGPIMGGMVVR